jgi:hypothetical protein
MLSNWERWEVPILATLGGTFGILTGAGLYGEISNERSEFTLIAIIVGAATYLFFDPIMELLLGWIGAPPRELPRDRKVATTLTVVAATVVISALHHSLGKELEAENGRVFLVVALVSSALTAGLVTLFWRRGAQRQPPRAATYGARTGALTGAAVGLLLVLDFALRHKVPPPPEGSLPAAHYAVFLGQWVGLPTLLWFGSGLLGGMAVDKRWGRLSPTRGILYSLAGLSGVILLLAAAVTNAFPLAWLLAAQVLGWGLGPFLKRESCDPQLDPSGALRPKLPETRSTGRVVVPIRPGQAISAEAPGFDEGQTPAARTQILLLKPTGDRMWALLLLVLALVAAGWAYTTGVLRTDPEIVSEIEARFQQDSGLHERALSVQSTNRVVTIAGDVNNALQNTAAVQEASSVRGVKQLIDQLQVAPPISPPSNTRTDTVVAPVVAPPPVVNASVSIVKGPGKVHAPGAQQPHGTQKTADAQKHHGFFHFLKKGKDKKDKTNNDNN